MKNLRWFIRGSLDLVESFFLLMVWVFSIPIVWVRNFPALYTVYCYMRVLLANGLMSAYLRTRLDHALGNCERATSLLDKTIQAIVDGSEYRDSHTEFVIVGLFETLVSYYLGLGDIERAVSALILAQKITGLEGVQAIPDLSSQQAQIIKAGLTAGRLLEEEGFQDLVDSGKPIIIRATTGEEPEVSKPITKKGEGKVLPFIRPEPIV